MRILNLLILSVMLVAGGSAMAAPLSLSYHGTSSKDLQSAGSSYHGSNNKVMNIQTKANSQVNLYQPSIVHTQGGIQNMSLALAGKIVVAQLTPNADANMFVRDGGAGLSLSKRI